MLDVYEQEAQQIYELWRGGGYFNHINKAPKFLFRKMPRFNIHGLYLKFSVALELIAEWEEVVD